MAMEKKIDRLFPPQYTHAFFDNVFQKNDLNLGFLDPIVAVGARVDEDGNVYMNRTESL